VLGGHRHSLILLYRLASEYGLSAQPDTGSLSESLRRMTA
jgi:hypothetical protein